MELKQLIKDYKRRYHLTNEQIAEQFGVTYTTVGRWINGQVKTVQEETAERMSYIFGFDVKKVIQSEAPTFKRPILGVAKAGYNMFLDNNYLGEEEVVLSDYNKGDFFLKVEGDSMIYSGITDGGLVFVERCETLNNGDIGVIAIGDEVTIKIFKKDKKGISLIASNPKVEDRYYTLKEVEELPLRIIGRVIYAKNYV